MRKKFRYLKTHYQYYPSPSRLIQELLEGLNIDSDTEINFLEPCAGDGSICREVKAKFNNAKINVIEIEPMLSASLKGQGFNVIGEDFENFETYPFYDLIIMNPPFNKGSNFLLKAYDLLGAEGILICILNAETIKNPCNSERKRLKDLIDRCGETIFIENAFTDSEHKTDVEIAIVSLNKPVFENEFDLFGEIRPEILTEEEKIIDSFKETMSNSLMKMDKIDNAINIYRSTVSQVFKSINTINTIKNNLSYLGKETEEFNIDVNEFIKIILEEKEAKAKEESIKTLRKMIWSYILKSCKMDKYLFYKQREKLYKDLDEGTKTLPFTKEYIGQFFNNLIMKREELFKEGITDLFDQITSFHSGNRIHREGWKTNKNWKINKKIIVDWLVQYDDYGDWGKFSVSYGYNEWVDDLDRIVRKLSPIGYMDDSHGWDIKEKLREKFSNLERVKKGSIFDNECETPYFKLKFFRKGSLHIIFKDLELLEKLNQLGASIRRDLGWDDYGKNI